MNISLNDEDIYSWVDFLILAKSHNLFYGLAKST